MYPPRFGKQISYFGIALIEIKTMEVVIATMQAL